MFAHHADLGLIGARIIKAVGRASCVWIFDQTDSDDGMNALDVAERTRASAGLVAAPQQRSAWDRSKNLPAITAKAVAEGHG